MRDKFRDDLEELRTKENAEWAKLAAAMKFEEEEATKPDSSPTAPPTEGMASLIPKSARRVN